MSWTPEQLLRHQKVNSLLGVNIKPQAQTTAKAEVTEQPGEVFFVVVGDPMGKPRMTQRDVWNKRPVVLRYHDYKDRIKEATPNKVLTADVYGIDVVAHIAMPASWSKKKKAAHAGKICRSKPDWDNIGKAVCDTLFEEDSGIADGRTRKFWCREGEQRTEIKVFFFYE
jgi:Holliday junction resolvase RusA-like endonuclease